MTKSNLIYKLLTRANEQGLISAGNEGLTAIRKQTLPVASKIQNLKDQCAKCLNRFLPFCWQAHRQLPLLLPLLTLLLRLRRTPPLSLHHPSLLPRLPSIPAHSWALAARLQLLYQHFCQNIRPP